MTKKLFTFILLPFITLAACVGEGGGSTDNQPEPIIESISTDHDGKAVAGESVTLHGKNFSPVASDNKVLYGIGLDAVALRVDESSEEHIVFTAPELIQTQIKIRVSTKGKESNSVVLEFVEKEEPWDDKPTITLAGAKTVTIRPGVEWTTFHGKWEGQYRNINIVRTELNGKNHLGIYFNYTSDSGKLYLDEKCEYLGAVAGTNGPMACCQFVRVDGEVKHSPTDTSPWIANSALTIDDGDAVDIVKVADNYAAKRLPNKNVGCAGPMLVWNGVIQENPQEWKAADTDNWLSTTHPRTAIGLSKDGKTVVQVTVDGRWSKKDWPVEQTAIGMSTQLLAKLMRGLGCYKAMNFDGGGGTAMWVYGQGNARHIVNHVCENRWNWDGTELRSTGNAVYITSD